MLVYDAYQFMHEIICKSSRKIWSSGDLIIIWIFYYFGSQGYRMLQHPGCADIQNYTKKTSLYHPLYPS